jgi:hypothetical protein
MDRDYVGEGLENIAPHVEDDLRTGALPMILENLAHPDELVHTLPEHPFCQDQDCPCHEDEELKREYLVEPWQAGHLAEKEAERLYRGQQIR